MTMHHTLLALSLALLGGNAMATFPGSGVIEARPDPANRIVGLWTTTVYVTPCQGGPVFTINGASVFHAGGTLGETNTSPTTDRGPGQGIWRHLRRGEYKTKFRFFTYQSDGSLDAIQEIATTTFLNNRATQYEATVSARVLNPDGSLRFELCGEATGVRVNFD